MALSVGAALAAIFSRPEAAPTGEFLGFRLVLKQLEGRIAIRPSYLHKLIFYRPVFLVCHSKIRKLSFRLRSHSIAISVLLVTISIQDLALANVDISGSRFTGRPLH